MPPPYATDAAEFVAANAALLLLFANFTFRVLVCDNLAMYGIDRATIETFVDSEGWPELTALLELPMTGAQVLLERHLVLATVAWLRKQRALAVGGGGGRSNGGANQVGVGYVTAAQRIANAVVNLGAVATPGEIHSTVVATFSAAMVAAPVDEGGLDIVRVILEGGVGDPRLPDLDADLDAQCAPMAKQGDSISSGGLVRRSTPEVLKHKTKDAQRLFINQMGKSLERRQLLIAAGQCFRLMRWIDTMPDSVSSEYWARLFKEGGCTLARPCNKELLDEILLAHCPEWYSSNPAELKDMKREVKLQDKSLQQMRRQMEILEESVASRTKNGRRSTKKLDKKVKIEKSGDASGSSDGGSGSD